MANGCQEWLDVNGVGRDKASCCLSCHADADEGYGDLMEEELNGHIYRVCCAISLHVDRSRTPTGRHAPSEETNNG